MRVHSQWMNEIGSSNNTQRKNHDEIGGIGERVVTAKVLIKVVG